MEDISVLFERISDLNSKVEPYKRSRNGAKKLKKTALGWIKKRKLFTQGRLSVILYETGLAKSLDQAREQVIPLLIKSGPVEYASGKLIIFKRIKTPNSNEKYLMLAHERWEPGY